jgi:hypothetical protein
VEALIKLLKNRTTLGLDEFRAYPPLPPTWKHATKVIIPKLSKDSTNCFPYRPISFLNIAGKIFEKILSNRLKNFLETNNLLPLEQFGFRSERSTINPNLESHTDTTWYANLKECPLAVSLDMERPFNKVWYNGGARNS